METALLVLDNLAFFIIKKNKKHIFKSNMLRSSFAKMFVRNTCDDTFEVPESIIKIECFK